MGLVEKTVAGGQRFLIQQELPMSLIRTSAHRSLMTEAEQRQWLQMLLDRMQAELVARKVAPESRRARLGACGSTSASNRSITPSRRVACICTPHRDSPWDGAADDRGQSCGPAACTTCHRVSVGAHRAALHLWALARTV